MRVLFRTRVNAQIDQGGDYLQAQRTLAPLQALGIEGVLSNDPDINFAAFDLIHLYGLGDPRVIPRYVSQARRHNKPFVVTPIYWRHDALIRARHEPQRYPEFALTALAPAAQARVRRIQTLEEELYTLAQKLACAGAEIIFPQSRAEAAQLVETCGAETARIRIAPNAADDLYARGDAARFQRRFGLQDFVLCIARFQGYKNQTNLIRAWRDAPAPLAFVGQPIEAHYLEWCQRLAAPNVFFLGAMSSAEIADACAAARVHVLSSWYEVVGMSALEAARAGCNLVMTQESPAREYFGDACFLCDPDDPASIRRALDAALAAPRPPRLDAAPYAHASWQKTAEIVAQGYAEALSRPARAWQETYRDTLSAMVERFAELEALQQPNLKALEKQLHAQKVWGQDLLQRYAKQNRP